MRIVVAGHALNLTSADFVAQGGEASVYARGGVAYKVFTDPSRVPVPAKLAALRRLAVAGITAPEASIHDDAGRAVGFTLPYLPDWMPLVRLFSPSYKARVGVRPQQVAHLAERLAELVAHAHQAGATIADLSELNVLVDPTHDDLALIDVDSWAIGSWPATALADSIRDRHTPRPNERSDWFAYAVLMFQLFVGLHPYRGRLKGVNSLDDRMQRNLSVFRPEVVVPPMVDLTCLPAAWSRWFVDVFEHGHRGVPPTGGGTVIRTAQPSNHATLHVAVVHAHPEPLIGALDLRGALWVWSASGLYCEGRRVGPCPPAGSVQIIGPEGLHSLFVRDGVVFDVLPDGTEQTTLLRAHRLFGDSGTVVAQVGSQIVRYGFRRVGTTSMLIAHPITSAPPNCTVVFRGCAVTSGLAGTWICAFTDAGAHQFRAPALEGQTVVDAIHRDGLVVVVTRGSKGGTTHRFFRGAHISVATPDDPSVQLIRLGTIWMLPTVDGLTLLPPNPLEPGRSLDTPMPPGTFALAGRPVARVGQAVHAFSLTR